jgi:hypothetical protein
MAAAVAGDRRLLTDRAMASAAVSRRSRLLLRSISARLAEIQSVTVFKKKKIKHLKDIEVIRTKVYRKK